MYTTPGVCLTVLISIQCTSSQIADKSCPRFVSLHVLYKNLRSYYAVLVLTIVTIHVASIEWLCVCVGVPHIIRLLFPQYRLITVFAVHY